MEGELQEVVARLEADATTTFSDLNAGMVGCAASPCMRTCVGVPTPSSHPGPPMHGRYFPLVDYLPSLSSPHPRLLRAVRRREGGPCASAGAARADPGTRRALQGSAREVCALRKDHEGSHAPPAMPLCEQCFPHDLVTVASCLPFRQPFFFVFLCDGRCTTAPPARPLIHPRAQLAEPPTPSVKQCEERFVHRRSEWKLLSDWSPWCCVGAPGAVTWSCRTG